MGGRATFSFGGSICNPGSLPGVQSKPRAVGQVAGTRGKEPRQECVWGPKAGQTSVLGAPDVGRAKHGPSKRVAFRSQDLSRRGAVPLCP